MQDQIDFYLSKVVERLEAHHFLEQAWPKGLEKATTNHAEVVA
jgi:hypothetical protein